MLAATAAAQPSPADMAAAQALFEQGKALVLQDRAAEACIKFEENLRLDAGIGTQYHLASCYERTGRLASGWALFNVVAAAARAAGDVGREQAARERAAALAPRLSRLTIVVGADAVVEGLVVERDGEPVGSAQWGAPIPLDPGGHAIEARAPGRQTFRTEASIEREGETRTIAVPRLDPEVAPRAQPVPAASPDARRAVAPPPSAREPGGAVSLQAAIGIGFAVLGAIGVGAGTALAVAAKNDADESLQYCRSDDPNLCALAGVELRDTAIDKGNAATAVLVVSAALAGGGAILWLTAPSAAGRVALRPWVNGGAATVAMRLAW